MNAYAKWFGRVVGLGVLVNLGLSLPTLFVPDRMPALFHLEPAVPLVWVQFSANLLILLSLFYLPAAIAPDHYRANAWLAIGSRFAGFLFFLFQPASYLVFGLLDLSFAIPEGILWWLALRTESRAASHTYQQGEV